MITLALDTSARGGSCAVLRDDLLLADLVGDRSRSQGERLPAELMAVLDRAAVPLARVDVFAVAVGPGSFTGVRVGIATMQGLALAAGRPLVGVSVLDALARLAVSTTRADVRVATWIDAWRGEVYAGLYERGQLLGDVTVERPAHILPRLMDAHTLFTGDGAVLHREAIAAAMGPFGAFAAVAQPPVAATIGLIAHARVRAGHCPGPEAVQALYVRRPDVELVRERDGGR